MNRAAVVILMGLSLSTLGAQGQDSRPWWRQLFGTEAAVPSEGTEPSSDEEPALIDREHGRKEVEPLNGVVVEEASEEGAALGAWEGGVEGTVTWWIPEDIAALDSAKVDPRALSIPGYRVQLFMGRLDSARQLRQSLLSEEEWGWPLYITPYPPLFGLTCGNFTSALAAHRACRNIKTSFPLSLVVPLSLPLDEVHPRVSSGFQASERSPMHRD